MPRNPGTGVYEQPLPDVITATTIESAVYNGFVNDVETDLNAPRPVIAGGTGADNATEARDNLNAEVSGAVVTNYDTHVFENGSFYSNAAATGGPVAATSYWGIAYGIDANNVNITVRHGPNLYNRYKVAGVWGTWTDSMTLSGDVIIDKSSPTIYLDKTAATQNCAIISRLSTGHATRWSMQIGNSDPEIGSNIGSNFALYRCNDGGTLNSEPTLFIDRSDGTTYVTTDNFTVKRPSPNSAQGQIFFGNLTGKYLLFNGTDFYLNGGHLFLEAGKGINCATGQFSGAVNVGSNLTVTGTANVGSNLNVTGELMVQNPAPNTAQGLIHFGNSVAQYLWFNSTDFHFGGGNLYIDSGYGLNCATGQFSGAVNIGGNLAVTGTVYSSNLMGAKSGIYIDAVNSTSNPALFFRDEIIVEAGKLYWSNVVDEMILAHWSGTTWRMGSAAGTGWVASSTDTTYKPSGGAWIAGSDARIKTVHGDYQHGLDEVLALRPVIYSYKGNDHFGKALPEDPKVSNHSAVIDKQFVGLVAQECETVMPEMVAQVQGFIDGQPVTDMRTLDTTALIYALVNSIKTLTARIEVLEATQATP